jgi:hypothetical protein
MQYEYMERIEIFCVNIFAHPLCDTSKWKRRHCKTQNPFQGSNLWGSQRYIEETRKTHHSWMDGAKGSLADKIPMSFLH